MKKTRVLPLLLAFCLGLTALAGCGTGAGGSGILNKPDPFEKQNPIAFLEETLYTMDLGASTLSVNENGEVVSGEFYFLAESDSDKSHYRVTYQKSDGVAKATDLKDAPFEGTNRGFLMQLRRALVELIEEFPGKAMEIKYVPLGYNFNLSQYAGIYYHAYNASSFTKVTADTSFHYNNYLEVTVGEEVYFVALGTNALN